MGEGESASGSSATSLKTRRFLRMDRISFSASLVAMVNNQVRNFAIGWYRSRLL